MNSNNNNTNKLQSKIRNLNDSINKMVGCVKHLEKMRSYSYLSTINEGELTKVLEHLEQIEESIDKISAPNGSDNETNTYFKAIGKDKKLLVSKPAIPQKGGKSNPISLKYNDELDDFLEKEITSESYHTEAKKRARELTFRKIK